MASAAPCTGGSGATAGRPSPTSAANGRQRTRACTPGASSDLSGGETPPRSNARLCNSDGDNRLCGRMSDDLEHLYKTMYTAVVRFLYRKLADGERAEELAQEVFIRALTRRPDKPRAWIFAVAANLARDEVRAAVRRRRHLTLLKGDPIVERS